jgi:hypothetical protein
MPHLIVIQRWGEEADAAIRMKEEGRVGILCLEVWNWDVSVRCQPTNR